jgi:hypothetical protein
VKTGLANGTSQFQAEIPVEPVENFRQIAENKGFKIFSAVWPFGDSANSPIA